MPLTSDTVYSFDQAKGVMAEYIRSLAPSLAFTRIEIKIKPIDQIGWLSAQDASVKIFGANQDDSAAIAGIGEALNCAGKGKVNYKKIFKQLRSHLTPRYPYLQWYGGFSFDASKTAAGWGRFGSWRFVLPRFELARDKNKMIFCCNFAGRVDKSRIIKELSALNGSSTKGRLNMEVSRRKDCPQAADWANEVNEVLRSISRGKCRKVVLARKTDLFLKEMPDPWAMLKTLKKVTSGSYHFAFGFGPSVFLGASPERLYKRQGRTILSEALAGTKPANTTAKVLLQSVKDKHEHQLVVEAIAYGLKHLCGDFTLDSKPGIKTLSNGHHLNTKFQGQLKEGVRDEDILELLHPTPALGGVPRDFALQYIRRKEPFARGWYAGPLGYVGFDWAEFVVGIRSGLINGKCLSVFAGAGIVAGSGSDDEWNEIENKISNFIKIIK